MIVAVAWETGLGRLTLETLGAAARIAGVLGDDLAFVSVSSSTAAAEAACGFGAARAFRVQFDDDADTGAWLHALESLTRELGARAILLPDADPSPEVAPRLAARLGGTAVTHVVSFEHDGDSIVCIRPVFGGKALASVVAVSEPLVVTLRSGAFELARPTGAADSAAVETRTVPPSDGSVTIVEAHTVAAGGTALDDARVIVAGGRGIGSAESFSELEELAALLGATVGASLAAVDQGWATAAQQVGLTGKAVSPDLYLAFGISGASQHLAGLVGARTIVAVNADEDAPIFAAAQIGVVADCREFVPALIDRLRRSAPR